MSDRNDQSAPHPDEAQFRKLYDNSPPPAESRDRSPLPERPGEFYSQTQTGEILKQRGTELFTQAGIDSTAQQEIARTFDSIRKTTGLTDTALSLVMDGHLGNLLAESRVVDDPDAADTALAQQIEANNRETRDWFIATFGRSDAESMLDRTRRFVRQHPALAKMLQARGLGSRPEIVREIAYHVHSTGWR